MRRHIATIATLAVTLTLTLGLVATATAQSEDLTVRFELTVTGEPPADAAFFGILGEGDITVPLLDRDGDGVYTFQEINVTEGEQVTARIIQATGETEEGEPGEPITVIEEFGPLTVTESQVLEATVSFDDDEQVPDNQQDGEDKDTGAGDEQETPDNQQDDAQDDQQGEMPGEMPDTGAGSLASGATIPVGSAAAGLTMLAGAGYAVMRRR